MIYNVLFVILGGQSDFDVRLVVQNYVEKGASLQLLCENNVQREILYKVCINII